MPKIRCSYQLHIQLCDTKPGIWRRLIVADSTSLAQLHRTIQAAMGWHNRHLYNFEIAGQRYGIPDADWPEDPTMDARRYTLGQLLQGQAMSIRYLYDFGDGWLHRIKVEDIHAVSNEAALHSLPLCTGGRNSCPPEDCGGTPAYAELLQALLDTAHPQHKKVLRQYPGFDPKQFDVQLAQQRIHALQLPRIPANKVKPESAVA